MRWRGSRASGAAGRDRHPRQSRHLFAPARRSRHASAGPPTWRPAREGPSMPTGGEALSLRAHARWGGDHRRQLGRADAAARRLGTTGRGAARSPRPACSSGSAEPASSACVLIHHPPLPGQAKRFRGLEDAAGLEAVLSRHGAELVMHGHNHRNMLAWGATGARRRCRWSARPPRRSGGITRASRWPATTFTALPARRGRSSWSAAVSRRPAAKSSSWSGAPWRRRRSIRSACDLTPQPWLAGYLYDATKSYDLMWWISIALGLFAAAVHWPIQERPGGAAGGQPGVGPYRDDGNAIAYGAGAGRGAAVDARRCALDGARRGRPAAGRRALSRLGPRRSPAPRPLRPRPHLLLLANGDV